MVFILYFSVFAFVLSFYSANVAFRARFLFQEPLPLLFFCANSQTSSKLPLPHKDKDKDKKDFVTRLSKAQKCKVIFILTHSFWKMFFLLFFFTCDKTCFTVCLDIEKLWAQYILITGSVICSRKYQNNNLLRKELQKA